MEVEVASRGALDVPASAFGGQPFELHFGARILALLETKSDAGRPAVREPKVEVANTALHIGPALLTRQHRLRYTLLLDGKPTFQPVGDLENVIISESSFTPMPKPLFLAFTTGIPMMIIGMITTMVLMVTTNTILATAPGLAVYLTGAIITFSSITKVQKMHRVRNDRSRN
ncbi:hypothetical protein ACFWN2_30720 [Lentzea sp. NPDC058436]|uniref:hypothetical protein n=1 Tax=Lentzea sp. NPDC058436 TaxID=3346499 RepID=UPI00364604A2